MKPAGQRAVIIFIDNSAKSIDGDFSPNRLTAQINTVERYAQWIFSENTSVNSNPDGTYENSGMNGYNNLSLEYENLFDNREPRDLYSNDSLVAVGTLGSEEFSIRTSFTSNYLRLEKSLSTIKSGGTALLDRAIKLGFMALKHAPPSAQLKLIIFINYSELNILENSLDDKKIDELNKKILENKKITVNFIVIGGNDSYISSPNIPNLQGYQNYANSIPQNISTNSSSQSLPILPNDPLVQNMIQTRQFYIQNQLLNSSDTTNSKKRSKSKKNVPNNNDGISILQRIIKKAKHASIMIIHTCSTILSDVVMATELGLSLPSGSQLILGAPASGSRKHNANIINNANIRNSNSSINGIIYEPDHDIDIGYGLGPRIGIGNVNLSVADMKMLENELKQSQLQSAVATAMASPAVAIPLSSPAIKKERKAQKINKIVFQNSNISDNQLVNFPIPNAPLPEPKPAKQTRGRKPKYSPSYPANQMNSSKLDFTLTVPQVIMSYTGDSDNSYDFNIDMPTNERNPNKSSLSTSSSISISSNSNNFPPTIPTPMMQNIQPVLMPQTTRKQKTSKGRNAKIVQIDQTDSRTKENSDNPLPAQPTRQRKPRKTKKIDEDINN